MSKKTSFLISSLLILVGISGRLLPHPWNVTPITAIALFSTTYLSLRYSFVIFLVTMIITDFFLGFYQWQIMLSVYSSFMLAGVIGLFVRKHRSAGPILVGTLASTAIFFLVTNWAVWQFSSMYAHTFTGLLESYAMAIPFLKNSLAGDLFYAGLFFGTVSLCGKLFTWRNSKIHLAQVVVRR